jgi:predicted nicotinamide N-methyase
MNPIDLQAALSKALSGVELQPRRLPGPTGLHLWLLVDEAAAKPLGPEAARRVAEAPPYWSLCWASGLIVADFICTNPHRVRGCTVVDFGAGSGVVALAAAQAGARRVIAVDRDPVALDACRINAALNGLSVECLPSLDAVEGPVDVITGTDIFYDAANLPLIDVFRRRAARLLIGESRRSDLASHGLRSITTVRGSMIPAFGDPQFERVEVLEGGS